MSTCPKCGTQYPTNVRFCTRDGAVLDDEATPESGQIGKVVAGKYRLDAYLSRGGMGSVFRAMHLMLEKPVALKIIKPELVGSSEFVRRFQREARAATSLSHPNIVAVYDLGQADDGTLYIAMEFVDGPSLKDAIQRSGPMAPERIARVMQQVLSGLSLAHRNHIVHRDLKPQNIMLTTDRDGRELAKLVDFGIAKTFDDRTQLTATGFAIGTPQYMAPEQASGSEVDGRSDLYSLGVILYEMLVADVPFNAPSTPAILVKHLTEAPIRPSLRRSDVQVHHGLEEVAVRCLEKEPGKRFQSAEEMAQAVAAAVPLPDALVAAPPFAAAATATHAAVPAVSPAASGIATIPASAIAPVMPQAAPPMPATAVAAAPQPAGVANLPPAPVVKGGRNSLALGIGALAIVALAGMGFAVQHFVSGTSPESSMLGAPPAGGQSQHAPEPAGSTDSSAATPASPPTGTSTPPPESPAAPATDGAAGTTHSGAGSAQAPAVLPPADSGTNAVPASGRTASGSSNAGTPPTREAVRQLAPNARATVTPSPIAAAERGTAPPPSPPPAPAAPAAPQLAENPTVLLRCDGATEVCGAVRDAFGAALDRERMPLTSSAPRADIYIVVSATAVDGQVQQQFGTTFVTRNYVIGVELEAPKMESAPSAPQARTFSADLRVGRERVNENARLVAMDTVQKIRDFWTRRRSGQ